ADVLGGAVRPGVHLVGAALEDGVNGADRLLEVRAGLAGLDAQDAGGGAGGGQATDEGAAGDLAEPGDFGLGLVQAGDAVLGVGHDLDHQVRGGSSKHVFSVLLGGDQVVCGGEV